MTDGHASMPAEQRRIIVESATNGMLLVDPAGAIVLANAEAERIFGYRPGSLLGQSAATLGCAAICAATSPATAGIRAVDPLTAAISRGGELTARQADGTIVPVVVSSRPMMTESGSVALITVGRAFDPRFGNEPSVAPVKVERDAPGRWRYFPQTGEVSWSDDVYGIVGRPLSDVLTIERALGHVYPEDRDRVVALATAALEHGTAFRDEVRIVRTDGSTRTAVYGGEVERSVDGTVAALRGFIADVTETKHAARERQRLDQYVTLANRSGKIAIWELDLRTDVSIWDPNMYELYGIADTSIPATFELWLSTLHPHDREHAVSRTVSDIASGGPSDVEYRVIWPNGAIRHIRSLATAVYDTTGAPARIIGTDWDVTEIRSLGEQLREEKDALINSEARYRALTEAMPQLVWVVDGSGSLQYINERCAAYHGLALIDARAVGANSLVHPADAETVSSHRGTLPPREFECEVRLRRRDGVYRWHLLRSVPFNDATGDAGKWITTATDIEERKAAERILAATVAELEHRAHHDPMTNLPNRMLLMDRLTQAMLQANRSRSGVLVLYVDLDRFKAINDSMGHAAGDCVLRETGTRIVATLRAGDTASRVGGDEFIVVCETDGEPADIAHIATRLLAAITAPIDALGELVIVEASIGVSMYPVDGSDADTLIRKADAAMYAAKQNGRNTFRRFSDEAHTSIVAAADYEAELRHAIATDELVVHFQPIIDLDRGRPCAAEALVRWQHPRRGLLPPGEFIDFAEERGLIAQIGDVVLEKTCAMLAHLGRTGCADVRVAVNVSAHQFGKLGFVQSIVAALDRHGVEPHRLTVEITESVVMGNTLATLATLDELRDLGVHLSLDDFGTGYSSLAYIKNFPIGTLKIDRSFVRDIADDAADQAIAKTIITLAHSLRMSVVAEGVETCEQLTLLRSFGVDSIQGYVLSRPLPGAEFEHFLAAYPAWSCRTLFTAGIPSATTNIDAA